jgi:hypothetical protein
MFTGCCSQVDKMGSALTDFMKAWKIPRLLTTKEVVGALLELVADPSGGGARGR